MVQFLYAKGERASYKNEVHRVRFGTLAYSGIDLSKKQRQVISIIFLLIVSEISQTPRFLPFFAVFAVCCRHPVEFRA